MTGCRFLLETGDSRLLVDCGLFQLAQRLRREPGWLAAVPDDRELVRLD